MRCSMYIYNPKREKFSYAKMTGFNNAERAMNKHFQKMYGLKSASAAESAYDDQTKQWLLQGAHGLALQGHVDPAAIRGARRSR